MWTGEIQFSALLERGRWKVEFFSGDSAMETKAGFELSPLSELVNERRETLEPQAMPNEELNYIGLENVQPVTGDLIDFKPKAGREILSRSKAFRCGDVLYGRLRPYLNKVYLAEPPIEYGVCSNEFFVLTPRPDRVLPHYLRCILSSRYVQRHVGRWQTGSALPRLQLSDLLSIEVPVPDIATQRKYEAFLMHENHRRRKLAAEVAALPSKILDTVLSAIESGCAPEPFTSESQRSDTNIPDAQMSLASECME